MTLRDELFTRADELMENAPGRVSVRRISQIDDVKVLRAARAALTGDEGQELRDLRLQMMERLDGAVAVVPPAKPDKKKGLLGALLSPLMGAAKGMSKDMRTQGEFSHMVSQAGGPPRLPAPPELLDAVEAWAIAYLVADRVDDDVSLLRRPLEEATIEPVAG